MISALLLCGNSFAWSALDLKNHVKSKKQIKVMHQEIEGEPPEMAQKRIDCKNEQTFVMSECLPFGLVPESQKHLLELPPQ